MDPVTLAATLTTTLAPALPYILAAAQSAAETVGEKITETALAAAKSIWQKITKTENPFLQQAAREVAKTPNDPDAQASLRLQIRKILEADPNLRAELEKQISTQNIGPQTAHASGHGSVAITGGAFGNTITTNGAK